MPKDREQSKLDLHAEVEDICKRCGRPYAVERIGSMTSWLFSQGRCTCGDRGIKIVASPSPFAAGTPGTVLLGGKYEIICQIGKGGISTVYKVRHVTTHAVYAAKVLKE